MLLGPAETSSRVISSLNCDTAPANDIHVLWTLDLDTNPYTTSFLFKRWVLFTITWTVRTCAQYFTVLLDGRNKKEVGFCRTILRMAFSISGIDSVGTERRSQPDGLLSELARTGSGWKCIRPLRRPVGIQNLNPRSIRLLLLLGVDKLWKLYTDAWGRKYDSWPPLRLSMTSLFKNIHCDGFSSLRRRRMKVLRTTEMANSEVRHTSAISIFLIKHVFRRLPPMCLIFHSPSYRRRDNMLELSV